jgi:hypothetical protein
VKRLLIIAVAVVALLGISFVVARWLNADTDERGQVVELLRAQARGDADAMLRGLEDCRDAACIATQRANARRLRDTGAIKIALYSSGTAHALRSRTKPTRVVWFTRDRLTTVQCVLVKRTGNVFAGLSVSLLRLSAPIGRESSCP